MTNHFSRQFPRQVASRTAMHPPAVLVGAAATIAAYLLVTVAVLPGLIDVVAALPDAVRLGALLLVSSGTRIVGGWFAVRRVRHDRGLRRRSEGVLSASAAGLVAWIAVTVLAAVAGAATGATWLSGSLLLELLRWPAEAALGGLLVFPGPPDHSYGRRS